MMDSVYSIILSDLRHGRLSHAVLLDAGSPADRLALARATAKALVCSGAQPPCGVCPHCQKAETNAHPDILVYTGAGSIGSFKVDTVREIRALSMVTPNEAARKVFILENAECMAVGAQNALLKILEEPPRYVTFLLTCASHTQLLETIRSRVTLYSLRDEAPAAELTKQQQLASQTAERILLAVAAHDEMQIMRETAALEKDKDVFRLCCQNMALTAAEAMKVKRTDAPSSSLAERLSSEMALEDLYAVWQTANETIANIASNTNGNLLLSYFCAQLAAGTNERYETAWQQ